MAANLFSLSLSLYPVLLILSSEKQKLSERQCGNFQKSLHESLKLSTYRLNAKPLSFPLSHLSFGSGCKKRMAAERGGARFVGER